MNFKYFGFTDAGKKRQVNEDHYLCNEEERLFLVADGIGGHSSGEVASRLAVEGVNNFITRYRNNKKKKLKKLRKGLSEEQNHLLGSALYANRLVIEKANGTPAMKGMGTTLVGATIEGDNLAVINAGDSRLYRVQDGLIEQMTEDHTAYQKTGIKGIPEDGNDGTMRHVLTSAIGIYAKPKIDPYLIEIQPGDLFLLCTDGLHHMLEDSKILEVIDGIQDKSLYKMGMSLVLEANLAGGMDNITVVLLYFEDDKK